VIDILSTWGDRHYVGLTGIQVFSSTGEAVPLNPQRYALSIRNSTIETKEAARIGYKGFFFRMSTQVKFDVRSTEAFT
jgi:hypothetical protein